MPETLDRDYARLKARLHKFNTCSRPDLVMSLIEQAIDAIDTLEGDLSVANLRLEARVCSECPAKDRVTELEAMLAGNHGMMQELAKAAGFHIGEQYSAASIIARLQGRDR